MSDTTVVAKELRDAQRAWEQARERNDAARYALHDAIAAALIVGMSQSEVARILGWPRQRVSKVLAER